MLGCLVASRKCIALIGAGIALIGTLITTSVSCSHLSFIPEMCSKIDNLEEAWMMLSDFEDVGFDDPDTQWDVRSQIPKDTEGFSELLRMMVSRNKKAPPTNEVIGMRIVPDAISSDQGAWFGTYHVQLEIEPQPGLFVVGELTEVSGWILDERLRWGLHHGFPMLLIGLFISFVAQVLALRVKNSH